MKIPVQIFEQIKTRLWAQADEDDWMTLNDFQKRAFYEQWVSDPQVGVVLANYMASGDIRVYLKDSVMKPYVRERSKDAAPILRKLGIATDEFVLATDEKPHTLIFHDDRVVCWGQAKNWKDVVVAVYERAKRQGKKPYAAVLLNAAGVTNQVEERKLIADFATRLGVERLEWLPD